MIDYQQSLTSESPFDKQSVLDLTAPHNVEAEQGLLGALLINNKAYDQVSEFLEPDHFYDPGHGKIYGFIRTLINQGQVADPVTLRAYIENDPLLGSSGAHYLDEIMIHTSTMVLVQDYGRVIYNDYLRRQLIEIGAKMSAVAYRRDPDLPPAKQIEDVETELFQLNLDSHRQGGFILLDKALTNAVTLAEEAYKKDSRVTGVTTGFTELDQILGGLHKSDLIIIAGRPAMGKTALGTTIGLNATKAYRTTNATDGAIVGFFSLEMSSEQIATRLLADQSNIPADKVRHGAIKSSDFTQFIEACHRLRSLSLFIDDTPGLTISILRARARRLKRTHNLGLIIIDYLQMLRSSTKAENRVLELGQITRDLKALAKELHLPVIALSQLNRAVESRPDKRPQLADLRESGAIEQDADVVIFLFREQYYLERNEPIQHDNESEEKFSDRMVKWQQKCDKVKNIGELIIAKHRHGPTGVIQLHFDGRFTRFSNLA